MLTKNTVIYNIGFGYGLIASSLAMLVVVVYANALTTFKGSILVLIMGVLLIIYSGFNRK